MNFQPTKAARVGWKPAHSPKNRVHRGSWPNEFGALEFKSSSCPWMLGFPNLEKIAERQAQGLLRVFRTGVLPSLGPFKKLPAFTSKEEVWHFQFLGWQIVNLDVSRKYGDIKVMWSRLTRWITVSNLAFSSPLLVSSLSTSFSFNSFF